MCLDEIISAPLDGLESVRVLAGAGHKVAVFDDAPREQRDGECHGKSELDIISCVIVASHQVHLHQKRTQNINDKREEKRREERGRGREEWCRVSTKYPLFEAVGEARMVAPGGSLVVGQVTGTLRLEVEEGVGESLLVVEGIA